MTSRKKFHDKQLEHLIPRKLRVTKSNEFHKSERDSDRRENRLSMKEQLGDVRPVKGARKIVVNGKTYYWLYKRSKIIIWSDDGTKHVYSDSDVTGMTSDNIERGRWKKWFSIGPGDIAKWITEEVEK